MVSDWSDWSDWSDFPKNLNQLPMDKKSLTWTFVLMTAVGNLQQIVMRKTSFGNLLQKARQIDPRKIALRMTAAGNLQQIVMRMIAGGNLPQKPLQIAPGKEAGI